MATKIKFELDKSDIDYTNILEFLLSLDCNTKIINYEDSDEFQFTKTTIIVCDNTMEIQNTLSANGYKYSYC